VARLVVGVAVHRVELHEVVPARDLEHDQADDGDEDPGAPAPADRHSETDCQRTEQPHRRAEAVGLAHRALRRRSVMVGQECVDAHHDRRAAPARYESADQGRPDRVEAGVDDETDGQGGRSHTQEGPAADAAYDVDRKESDDDGPDRQRGAVQRRDGA